MTLRFIIGPAGSGKTHTVIRSALDVEGCAIIIVPDQATFQTEKELLRLGDKKGFMDIHVLSFRRLCHRILAETGGLTKPFITATGKSMALQSILWKRKNHLALYGSLVTFPGFRDSLLSGMREFSGYGVDPKEALELINSEEMPFLGQKLHDMALIFQDYEEFLEGKFIDPDDYMGLALEGFSKSALLGDSTVFVDGFSGFNPSEYKVLGGIMRYARSLHVALCADAEEIFSQKGDRGVFNPIKETYGKIEDLSFKLGIKIQSSLILGDGEIPRFKDAPRLGALERRIKRYLGGPCPSDDAVLEESTPSVRLVAAVNPKAEIEFVAREILKILRENEGFRFSDITINTRDLEKYGSLISLVFKDHKIPLFLDMRKSVAHHPLVELLRASLDVVTSGFAFEPIMRFLKTDLAPLSRDEVDILENYVLAHGIKGEIWISERPWSFSRKLMREEDSGTKEQDEGCDAARQKAVKALADFYKKAKGEKITAKNMAEAIKDLLAGLNVPKILQEWESCALKEGDVESSMEHKAVWQGVLEILDQSYEILGDQPCDFKSYAVILQSGLEDIRIGVIPPSLDQVLVGDIQRSRQPECKVSFLCGALSGVFPKTREEDRLLSDVERDYLCLRGVEIEPSSKTKQLDENYLVYIALTRPNRTLYVTYPLADEEGKSNIPSHIIGYIKECVNVKEETAPLYPSPNQSSGMDFILPARIAGTCVRMLSGLREGVYPGDIWMAAYRYLLTQPSKKGPLRSFSFTNEMAPLDKARIEGLYGRHISTSVTRLERFGQCPFRHFVEHGLALRERDIFVMEPASQGVFLHEAMKIIVSHIAKDMASWETFIEEGPKDIPQKAVDLMIQSAVGEILTSSKRYEEMGESFKRIAHRQSHILHEHAKAGRFVPIAAEVRFGFKGELPPLVIPVSRSESILLRGQIDRIDAIPREEGMYIRVVDYKSSWHDLRLLDVYEGLSLQLLVYMIAALSGWETLSKSNRLLGTFKDLKKKNAIPLGALYSLLNDRLVSVSGPKDEEEAGAEIRKKFRLSGMLAGDDKIMALMDKGASGSSQIIPVTFTKKGLGKKSSCVSQEDFDVLLEFVKSKVKEMSKKVFSGDISLKPYRIGQENACTYCPFGSLCVFDVSFDGSSYRTIKKMQEEEIWEKIRSVKGGLLDGTDTTSE